MYGPRGFGKSEFASHLDKHLFIATEPGLNWLEVCPAFCRNWKEFQEIVTDMEEMHANGTLPYTNFIIDTIDNLYDFAYEYVCEKHHWEHPSDVGWGKAWKAISSEFKKWMLKLAFLEQGLIMIGHTSKKDVIEEGIQDEQDAPRLTGMVLEFIGGLADFVLCGKIDDKGNRYWYTKPGLLIEAKDRSAKLPPKMPVGYNDFIKCFKDVK